LISPVYDAPLLLAEGEERVLVAADLHLGLEHELQLCGISIPSQTEKILHRLLGYIDRIKPDRLVLLGDVKHNVPRTSWQEKREIPRFLSRLASRVAVDVVPGNHDSDLADMAPLGVQVRPSSGFVIDGVGYFHGHTWPDKKILGAGLLAAGHLHPAVSLPDPLARPVTRPIWVRSRLLPEQALQHYGLEAKNEIIVIPAFNFLCGGLPINLPVEDMRGPLLSLVDWDVARLFLLDGTELGSLAGIKAAQCSQEAKPARKGKKMGKG
jgi:putative SbcD/Mre11-related phosphoesterase